MKITSTLAIKNLKYNKKRNLATILRNNINNDTCNKCIYISYKLSGIYN